jgi:hypothetical protein
MNITIHASFLPHSDPVHKVTIIPRGQSLGSTMALPKTDVLSRRRKEMLDTIAVMMGGRIAEEMTADVLPSDYGTTETNGQQVAKNKKGIEHRFIDLSPKERSQFGIDRFSLHQTGQSARLSAPQFAALERFAGELRECIWLTRILTINSWPTLLVCGADHGPRVEHLFNSVGKLAILEVNDYEP